MPNIAAASTIGTMIKVIPAPSLFCFAASMSTEPLPLRLT